MAKAPRPPKPPPIPTPSDDPQTPDVESRCWQFVPTEIKLRDLAIGEGIRGNVIGSSIHLNSDRGSIGKVPSYEATEILEYLKRRARRLSGQVLSVGKEGPLVELCAI